MLRSLHRAARNPNRGGTPLPLPFKAFAHYGLAIRKGELTMIAAKAGSGKSVMAISMAMAMKVPTLYFSIDSGELTQQIRCLQAITGLDSRQVEEKIQEDPDTAAALIKQHAGHIKWDFDSESMWDVEEEFKVYRELMGEAPSLVILDNASDINYENGDMYQSLKQLMKELKRWARAENVAFVALHHVNGMDPNHPWKPCPPMDALQGKISEKPAVILTIGKAQDGFMPVAPVKNRGGVADDTGKTAMWLRYDPSTMTLKDTV